MSGDVFLGALRGVAVAGFVIVGFPDYSFWRRSALIVVMTTVLFLYQLSPGRAVGR